MNQVYKKINLQSENNVSLLLLTSISDMNEGKETKI